MAKEQASMHLETMPTHSPSPLESNMLLSLLQESPRRSCLCLDAVHVPRVQHGLSALAALNEQPGAHAVFVGFDIHAARALITRRPNWETHNTLPTIDVNCEHVLLHAPRRPVDSGRSTGASA